jgi:hypothetical protein
MSHNVQIKGVKINDLDALAKAINELQREGVNVSLERGTPGKRGLTFRTYGGFNNDNRADHVIRMPDCNYDIGLLQQAGGHYAPVYDNALGLSVACPIACAYDKPGNTYNFRTITDPAEVAVAAKGLAIGKLMQRYSAVVAERAAQLKGYRTQRAFSRDGALQVVINT